MSDINCYYVVLSTHDDRIGCIQIWASDRGTAEALAYATIRGGYAGIEAVHDARTWHPNRLKDAS